MTEAICGVDEAGRGPIAGPVIAAAVILDPVRPIPGLADSKVLSPARRSALSHAIRAYALAWSAGRATVEEIDRLNILQATLLAMQRAVEGLKIRPTFVHVDGDRLPRLDVRAAAIVGGDRTHPEISAASIIAKTIRDAEMDELARDWPGYGFDRHRGYPTREHLAAMAARGVTPLHRRSFAPVRDAIAGFARPADRTGGVVPRPPGKRSSP